ncbi:MAG: AI-2E family transporter [Phascolarctobacterium sp.]|nr:AI-2E family transporter [Phascolarctobacterium sp.]
MNNIKWVDIRKSTVFKLGVVAGVSYVLYSMAGFFLPVLISIALAFVLYPLVGWINSLRVGRGMFRVPWICAIILALGAFCIFLLGIFSFLILPLFGQMNEFAQKLPELIKQSQASDLNSFLTDPTKLPVLPSNLDMFVEDIMQWAMGFSGNLLRNLLKSSMDIASNLIGMVVVPFLTFYLLKDWREMRSWVVNFFNYEDQEKVAHVIDEIGLTISAYVRGLGKLSLLSGCIIAIGTMSLGLEYPLVLGFWAVLAETVPVVGPVLGAIPAVFLAYRVDTTTAVHVAIFYLIYYQLDANVIMPKIMGGKIDLHPFVIIASLIIGAKLFGILGMVFAVPVAAVYRVLYKELWHLGEEKA